MGKAKSKRKLLCGRPLRGIRLAMIFGMDLQFGNERIWRCRLVS